MSHIRRTVAALVGGTLMVTLAAAPGPAQATVDVTAPTISSVSVGNPRVVAGDPVVLNFVGHDDLSGVNDIVAQFSGPAGAVLNLGSVGGDSTPFGPYGPAAGVVPTGRAPGVYTLTYLAVQDRAGNVTTYTQGSAVSVPPGSPAVLDLSAVKVTVVQPGTVDVTAPGLTAFTMLSSKDRRRGEFVTWAFAANDTRSPITQVKVVVKDPSSQPKETHRSAGILSSGRISFWLPTDIATGHWTVEAVALTDSSGNGRSYSPKGIGSQDGQPPLTGPKFVGMGFDVSTGTPRPDKFRVFDTLPDATVTTRVTSALVAPGTAVSLHGTVAYLGHPVPYPTLAVYADTAAGRVLLGVTRGTSTGTFARRVVPTRPTVYRVLFLGSDRGVAAPATLGKRVGVRTGAVQRLTVATTAVRVAAGHVGALAVTVTPHRAGVLVTLMRKVGTAWRAAGSVRTRSTGAAALHVPRPASTTYYRWSTAYDGVGLPAVSAVVAVSRAK